MRRRQQCEATDDSSDQSSGLAASIDCQVRCEIYLEFFQQRCGMHSWFKASNAVQTTVFAAVRVYVEAGPELVVQLSFVVFNDRACFESSY